MEARLTRRIHRSSWNLAAAAYEPLWRGQLAPAQREVLASASLEAGERVLDVACGTGLVALAAAESVGARGAIVGVDLSERMVALARERARARRLANTTFARMDAESLDLPEGHFDAVLCALGLMYVPDPANALREMRRVLRPGGRLVVAVWGERSVCGWSSVFPIVDAEVVSELCPLFFRLGAGGALARELEDAGFGDIVEQRMAATLDYRDGDEACNAAFVGGPVALAWSRFDESVRARVRGRYLDSIEAYRSGSRYRVPGQFVIVAASSPRG